MAVGSLINVYRLEKFVAFSQVSAPWCLVDWAGLFTTFSALGAAYEYVPLFTTKNLQHIS